MSTALVPYAPTHDLALSISVMGEPAVTIEAGTDEVEALAIEAIIVTAQINDRIRRATRQESHNGQCRLR